MPMYNDYAYPTCDTSVYQGKRTDLENDEMGNYNSKEDLRQMILRLLDMEPHGVTAPWIEEYAGCSREWARKTLNKMVDEGILKRMDYGIQTIVFRKAEVKTD